MPNQDLSRISAAMIDAASAIEELDTAIQFVESRPPESVPELQLSELLSMTHASMIAARDRLQGLRIVGGTALGDFLAAAIADKSTVPADKPGVSGRQRNQLDRMDYLVSLLDYYLDRGDKPREAVLSAVDDYSHHYHHKDGKDE